ncbi:unnamed protein product [Camellia sinensis]
MMIGDSESMASQLPTNFRLVRCGRCNHVLPEFANIPVYQCGGCGTILQAKNRKNGTKGTGSLIHETDAAQKYELEQASEDRETGSLRQEESLPSTEELPLEKNSGSGQNEIKDSNREQSGDMNFSSELSTELTCHGNEESSPAAMAETDVEQDIHSLEQNNGGDQNEHGYCNGNQPGGVKFSDGVVSSTELNHHESEESSQVAEAHSEADENRNCFEQNNGRNQNEYGYCNGKHPGGENFSDEVVSSTELNHHKTEESSPVAGCHSEVDEHKNCLEQNNGRNQSEFGDCNGKHPGGEDFSNEVVSSTELNHHESVDSSLVAGARSDVDETKNCLEQNNGRNQSEFGDCNGKHPGDGDFSDEVASASELNHHEGEDSSWLAGVHSEVDENRNCLEQNNGMNRNEYGYCNGKHPGGVNFHGEVASSTELICQEIEESSPMVGINTKCDENCKSLIVGSSGVENLLAASPRDSIIAAQRLSSESILTDNLLSPHSKQLEQFQKRVHDGFDRVTSIDTSENTALANPSSEFSDTLRDMCKSPTTSSYYPYDGSVSSFDETDDQVPIQHPQLSKRKFKEAEYFSTKAMPRRDPKMQHQAWNPTSISSEKKHYGMKESQWCRDELLEPSRHGHPVRSRMKFGTDERQSRVPFYSRGSPVDYENGSPSNYGQNEFQCSTSYHLPNKPENPKEENIKLLKIVFELQDQLNRTHISEGKAVARSPGVARMQNSIPSCCDHVAPEVEICHDLRCARYPRRCNQGKNWQTRIPFSAEATVTRHQANHSCIHCCPQDWKCSAPLSTHICCKNTQHTSHSNQQFYDLYRSSPLSPRCYESSEFSLRSCAAKSGDHWHKNHEVKKYSRERRQLVKRYVRPVAGGAPFLVCYRCSEMLQLPTDFLLFKRRSLRLRCSACSVILKFLLQNGTHIVRYTDYTPDAIAPPPSEVDDFTDANNGRNFASVPYGGNCPHADPVSYSDDYGPSFCKSCSTEGEPFSAVLPFHSLKRDSNNRKTSSGSSFDPMEERKKQPIFNESRNKYRNHEVTGSPSKMSEGKKLSSEIEELPPRGGSSLHKLMGYSSPNAVMDI